MEEAGAPFDKAKEHFFLALDHISKERWADAEKELKVSLEYIPDRISTITNLCATLIKQKKFHDAKVLITKAEAIGPNTPEIILNQGLIFYEEKLYEKALVSFDRSIELRLQYAEAWSSRGLALNDLKRHEEALASYERSIELKPDYAEAWSNHGIALNDLRRHEEALASYERAIALKPDYAEAWNNRGVTLNDLKRHEEALASYERAIELKPDGDYWFGDLVHTQMKICDWKELEQRCQVLEERLLDGSKVSTPFAVLGLVDNPELQKRCGEIYAKYKLRFSSQLGVLARRPKREKVRIGYFSADFHNHATMYLMAELFELHDKSKFETYGFSFGPNHSDQMRRQAESAFDQFIDVTPLSDSEVSRLSREHGIDIAIDLKGYTQDSRPEIFAERAAPIQINYLGFPGTMGTQHLDYLIADPTLIPEDIQEAYSEKVIYLPNSYQVNDSKRKISDRTFIREEFGLPENGVVFCCFNNNWKIIPEIFDCWVSILKSVVSSVLWLLEDSPAAAENLRKEAINRNVDPSHLVFTKRMPHAEHLARYKLADLFLDTFPCNAHTTASDALWAGVPVLTLQGQSFASRVAASLLTNIGVPELITHSKEEYCSLAVELASNPDKLAAIKTKLAQNRLTTPLFNTKLFARHIESAYQAAYDRYHAGLPPDHIDVDP